MSLTDHLREIRHRLLLAGIGIAVGAVAGWFLYPQFFSAINAPLAAVAGRVQGAAISFGSVGSAFEMQIQLSLFIGLFLSSPWWVWQLFALSRPISRATNGARRSGLAWRAQPSSSREAAWVRWYYPTRSRY